MHTQQTLTHYELFDLLRLCLFTAADSGPALLDLSLPLSPKQKEGKLEMLFFQILLLFSLFLFDLDFVLLFFCHFLSWHSIHIPLSKLCFSNQVNYC